MLEFVITSLKKMQFFVSTYFSIDKFLRIMIICYRIMFSMENNNWNFKGVLIFIKIIDGLKY